MKIVVPDYICKNNYFWYVCRMLYNLRQRGIISVEYVPNKNQDVHFIITIFVDGQPVIFDFRDDASMPLVELRQYPNALVFKSNYSSELWDNPPATWEYPLTEEDRKYRSQIRPFVYGRAINLSYDTDEVAHYMAATKPIRFPVISYTGPGLFRQHTENRLRVYDLIKENPNWNPRLIWYSRDHFKNEWPEYKQRIAPYTHNLKELWGNYCAYLNFLSEGKYSLNMPGIAASQPFRLIDGVLANRAVISTKIWTDIYKTFPCNELPVCGYFGTGNWDDAKALINQLASREFDDTLVINAARQWYSHYLSVEGMFTNQFLKGLNNV